MIICKAYKPCDELYNYDLIFLSLDKFQVKSPFQTLLQNVQMVVHF